MTSLGILSTVLLSSALDARTEQPNVVIMLADDMGYDDLSIRGNTCVETPNLDWMAQNATCFNNFYVHSVSAPTRASLLTGRHFLRTGISGVHAGRDFMNLDEVTIAEAFKAAGYTTGMWGKWHSGKTAGYYPWERGFDEAYMAQLYKYPTNNGLLNGVPHTLPEGRWTDAAITDMAIDFMERNKENPFFVYLPYLSPHGKWDAPEEYVQRKMQQGQSRNFATLNGMIDHLDVQIGRVFDALEKEGLLENTIVVFFSDNGPISAGKEALTKEEWALRNPSQYRGNKGQNFENGIHSNLFVYWKGNYQATVNNSLLGVYDLFPTLCDIADVPIPSNAKKMDGVSFKPILDNPQLVKKDRDIYISQWHPFFEYHKDGIQEVPLTPSVRASIDADIQMVGLHRGDYKVLLNMWGEDKLAMWNLQKDYRETKELYKNGTAADKTLSKEYQKDILNWYNDILATEKSHQMPVFQIGLEPSGKTNILCYGPIELSAGLKNETFKLSGFDAVGDRAEYQVNIVREGKYSFGIRVADGYKGTATFKVFTDKNDSIATVTVSNGKTDFQGIMLNKNVTRIGIELITASSTSFGLSSLELLEK